MLLRFLFFLKVREQPPGQTREHQPSSFPITPLRRTVSQILICRVSEVNLRQSTGTVTKGPIRGRITMSFKKEENREGWCLKYTLECVR